MYIEQTNASWSTIKLDFEESVPVDLGATWSSAFKSNGSLTSLRFNRLVLQDAGAEIIAASLVANHTLVDLCLSRAGIGHDGAVAIANLLGQSHLTNLCLSHNSLGKSDVMRMFEAAVQSTTLQSLNLLHNGMTDWSEADVDKAASVVARHPTLQTIGGTSKAQLQGSVFAARGMDEFHVCVWSVLLRTSISVRKLDLASNAIGCAGASAEETFRECQWATCLARLLASNTMISELILDHNPLGLAPEMGVRPLVAAIGHITHLSLRNTRLDARGARLVADAIIPQLSVVEETINFYSSALLTLTLDSNPLISDKGVAALARVLASAGSALQSLSLLHVGASRFDLLRDTLAANKSLTDIVCDDASVAECLSELTSLPRAQRVCNRAWIRFQNLPSRFKVLSGLCLVVCCATMWALAPVDVHDDSYSIPLWIVFGIIFVAFLLLLRFFWLLLFK